MKNIETKIKRMRKLMLESEGESELERLKKGIRTILQKQKENNRQGTKTGGRKMHNRNIG